jgi:hypothetical protein
MKSNIILVKHNGRVGSNLLCEIYEKNGYIRINEPALRTIHIDIHSPTIIHDHSPTWLPDLDTNCYNGIFLSRRNKVAQNLSWLIAEHLEQILDPSLFGNKGPIYSAYTPGPEFNNAIPIEKFTIPISVVESRMRIEAEDEEDKLQTFEQAGVDYIRLDYEDLVDNRAAVLAQLGLQDPKDTWHRKSVFQAQDLVENYEEILEWNRNKQ